MSTRAHSLRPLASTGFGSVDPADTISKLGVRYHHCGNQVLHRLLHVVPEQSVGRGHRFGIPRGHAGHPIPPPVDPALTAPSNRTVQRRASSRLDSALSLLKPDNLIGFTPKHLAGHGKQRLIVGGVGQLDQRLLQGLGVSHGT